VVYPDRLDTYLLQLFAHPENSEWFSVIPAIIFEVSIVAAWKQAQLVMMFLFFASFHCPQPFHWPPAVPASLTAQPEKSAVPCC